MIEHSQLTRAAGRIYRLFWNSGRIRPLNAEESGDGRDQKKAMHVACRVNGAMRVRSNVSAEKPILVFYRQAC